MRKEESKKLLFKVFNLTHFDICIHCKITAEHVEQHVEMINTSGDEYPDILT